MRTIRFILCMLLLGSGMQAQLQLTNEANLLIEEGVTMTVEGDFYKKGNQQFELSGTFRLLGNWDTESNLAADPFHPGKLVLYSDFDQFITCKHDTYFNELDFGSGNGTVRIDTGLIIESKLNLNNRVFDLGGQSVYIGNSSDTAISRTFGYVYTGSHLVTGEPGWLAWQADTFAGNYVFPFGSFTGDDVSIEINKPHNNSIHFLPVLAASTYGTNPANMPNNRPLPNGVNHFLYAGTENGPRAVDRFWSVAGLGFDGPFPVQLRFKYRDSEYDNSFNSTNTITESNLRPLYWDGAQWQTTGGTINPTINTVTSATVTLSDTMPVHWTLSDNMTAFPINDLRVQGTRISKMDVSLSWELIENNQIDHYEVWRQLDVQQMPEKVGEQYAIGDSVYNYIDHNPHGGMSYYQIAAVDVDGGEKRSVFVAVTASQEHSYWKVFPNPAKDVIYIEGNAGRVEIRLFDHHGRLVLQEEWERMNQPRSLSLSEFAEGLYSLQILENGKTPAVFKIVVE